MKYTYETATTNYSTTTRPSKDEYFMGIARLVASRGTCVRRKVGCVLVNEFGHILATGYNGPPRGWPHCVDEPCDGADAPSGDRLDDCAAVHAEQNALLQCADPMKIQTAYITVSPCVPCLKLFLNTPCNRMVIFEPYTMASMEKLYEYWVTRGGRDLTRVS